MKGILLRIFTICIIFINIACSNSEATHENAISISTEEEWKKYHSVTGSEDIKFDDNDYIGEWITSSSKSYNFILKNDLSIEMGWRIAKCSVYDKTNNTLLLKCKGDLGVSEPIEQYVMLQIFYFAETKNEATLRLNITFNADLQCAKNALADSAHQCANDGWYANKYEMYNKKNF
jgi:hypothetical protein